MNALVLGCGRVGAGVARELTSRGTEVVVVDRATQELGRLGDTFPGRGIRGDILERQVLIDAGIAHADAVAVVTGSDRTNAAISLAARRIFRVPKVVARLYDPWAAEVYQRLGISTLAPVTWGIQRIADLVTATSVSSTVSLGVGGVEMVDVRIPALLDGRPAGELHLAGEIHVVALTRHGRTTLATPVSRLEVGDLAHLAVAVASLGRLETLLTHR